MSLKHLLGNELFDRINPHSVCEIRVRTNKPVILRYADRREVISDIVASREYIDGIILRATKNSLYAYQEEIRSQFLHYDRGIRIGLCGRGVVENNKIITFKDITSLNIRLAHEIVGVAEPLANILKDFKNTLVVSPPFGGKTTLIRDMARILSKSYDTLIIDEREEISSVFTSFGDNIDVISGVKKHLVVENALRTMSPEIIIMDELSIENDYEIVGEIMRSGVKILATLHGDDFDTIISKNTRLLESFTYGILLSYKPRAGSIKSIRRFRVD